MKRMLMLASVASMIDQFNMNNIYLLRKLGYEVHVACNFEQGNTCTDEQIVRLKAELSAQGVTYFQIDFARNVFKINQNVKAYRQILKLLREQGYEFVHCHSPIGGVCGRLAAHKERVKVIYTAHGFHFYKGAPILNWMIYYPIERFLAKYTDVLITINKEDYARAKKFVRKKLEYTPGIGIDADKFASVSVNREEKRKGLGFTESDIILLSVGELNKNKNHEVVLNALSKIDNKNIKYIICGRGDKEEYLTELAEKMGLENQFFLLGFRNDISEIYACADIFVFPSFREGLSVALMEAMASGLVVVGSRIRGNTDLIIEGKGGYLSKADDVEAFKNNIEKLCNDGKERRTMGDWNQSYVKTFDKQNVLKEMKRIYLDNEWK